MRRFAGDYNWHWQVSRYWQACLLIVLFLLLLAPWLAQLNFAVQLLLNVLALVLMGHYWLWQIPRLPNRLRYNKQGWQIYQAKTQTWHSIEIGKQTLLWPFLVVIMYRTPQQYFYSAAVVWRDALHLKQFKQLRLYLRFARTVTRR